MGTRRRQRAVALAAAAVLALVGCGDGDGAGATATPTADVAADCRAAVGTILATAQRYLDSIEASTPAGPGDGAQQEPAADPAEEERRFTAALTDVRAHAARVGCDPAQFRDDLVGGLRQLQAGGPIANAVLLQLQADAGARGRTGPVAPGDDVAAAVAAAAPDAVVQLEAGVHELTETLVLLRGVTLRGAGRDATVLQGAAGGGVVLVLTGDPVLLEDLTVAHVGDVPASVVSAVPAATLSLTAARVTGATGQPDGAGGVGLLMAAGRGGQSGPARRTSLSLADTEVVDNAVAGIVVSGEHRAEVTGAVLRRNGQCGICFLGTSDGAVRGSTLEQNAAGLVAAHDSRPLIVDVTVLGGEIGIQALDRAGPQVERATVSGSARTAFLFAGAATGSVRGSTCRDAGAGIVVGPSAAPEVDGNTGCELARGQ